MIGYRILVDGLAHISFSTLNPKHHTLLPLNNNHGLPKTPLRHCQHLPKLHRSRLLLKPPPILILIDNLLPITIRPLVHHIPSIDGLLIRKVDILVTAFELVVGLVWEIVDVVVVVVDLLPG